MASCSNVCVIGAGHVGAPHAIVMASKCPKVKFTVVDDDPRTIAAWNSGLLPFFEPGMQELLDDVRSAGNLTFTSDFDSAVRTAEVILVSVSTPLKKSGVGAGYAPNLEHWESVARRIAKVAGGPKIIVERSTVPVTTAASMTRVFQAVCSHEVVMLSNPEFAREGSAITDQLSPDRVMIGGPSSVEGEASIAVLKTLYSNWVPTGRIITSNLWSAEISKLTADAFLAQRISSINAISALCEKTGADVDEVSYAIGVDSRIGRKCLTASLGFGGVCYETHLRNLVYLAKLYRMPVVATYWDSVIKMNDYQKRRFANLVVREMFNTVGGKKLAVLGFSYKKNTSDCRFSAALDVCKVLENEQALLVVHDPRVSAEAVGVAFTRDDGSESLVSCEADPYVAMHGAHAVLVLTEWEEFTRLDFKRVYASMQKPAFIFDGRNLLDHKALREIGFRVYGIGKPQPQSETETTSAEAAAESAAENQKRAGRIMAGAAPKEEAAALRAAAERALAQPPASEQPAGGGLERAATFGGMA